MNESEEVRTPEQLQAALAERDRMIAGQAQAIAALQAEAARQQEAGARKPRAGGAMSARVDAAAGASATAQAAAENALASGRRIDLLRYLRLRRQGN